MTKELPHFVGWNKIEEGYFTKTKLKDEYGLKPIDENEPDATLKAYQYNKWKYFDLYHVDNTKEIKRRVIKDIEPTDKNIAEALYIINKSAKVSRDTKTENYIAGKHDIVKRSKSRQQELYELKNEVIEILLERKKATIKGYHRQHNSYLSLVEFSGFTFHMIDYKQDAEKHEFLGWIGTISADKTKSVNVKFYEGKKLLEKVVREYRAINSLEANTTSQQVI